MNVGVNQKIAPIRYFFIIQPNSNERFSKAMELAFSLWGGIFCPIFQYYKELPAEFRSEFNVDISTEDFYRNTVNNYDPDVIIIDEDIDIELIKDLSGGRDVIATDIFVSNISGSENSTVTYINIAEHFRQNEFKYARNDNAKFSIPKINENELLLKAMAGSVSNEIRRAVANIFENNATFQEPNLDWQSIEQYREDVSADVIELNIYKLKTWGNSFFHGDSVIYLLRSNRLQDVINYWNLRAAGWLIVAIPIDIDDVSCFKKKTKQFTELTISDANNRDNIAILKFLVGHSISDKTVDETIQKIIPDLANYRQKILVSTQLWFPRFWHTSEILDADHIKSRAPYCDVSFSHYESDNDRVRILPMKLPFEVIGSPWEGNYKAIISYSLTDEHAQYAELLTGITDTQLKQLINAFDFRRWRLSPAGMHCIVKKTDGDISFDIPKALDYFQDFFSNKSHKAAETVNSKLAKEVLKNMGGILQTSFFLSPQRLKIIELFEGGKEVHYATLFGEIKKQMATKKNSVAEFFIRRLLENKIVELGATLKCAVCGQHSFFLPNQLEDILTCPICRNEFHLPVHDPHSIVWSYRGIGPFSRTNKADGVIAVFATLKLFKDEFTRISGKISALIGFELIKTGRSSEPNPKEVDLGIILQNGDDTGEEPDLLFCECKTYKTFTEKDIERMKVLGDEFPGAILTFATLNQQLSSPEINLIAGLVKYFQRGTGKRPRNPILILTGIELLPEGFRNAFKEYKSDIKPYHEHNDFIGALCELGIKKHLSIPNWWDILEQRWLQEIQRREAITLIVKTLQNRFL